RGHERRRDGRGWQDLPTRHRVDEVRCGPLALDAGAGRNVRGGRPAAMAAVAGARGAGTAQHRGGAGPWAAAERQRMSDHPLIALIIVIAPLSLVALGGASAIYAPLQYQAVDVYHWVTGREYLELFAIARVTPGPGSMLTTILGW